MLRDGKVSCGDGDDEELQKVMLEYFYHAALEQANFRVERKNSCLYWNVNKALPVLVAIGIDIVRLFIQGVYRIEVLVYSALYVPRPVMPEASDRVAST